MFLLSSYLLPGGRYGFGRWRGILRERRRATTAERWYVPSLRIKDAYLETDDRLSAMLLSLKSSLWALNTSGLTGLTARGRMIFSWPFWPSYEAVVAMVDRLNSRKGDGSIQNIVLEFSSAGL